MKTYVLTLSKIFMKGHPKVGQQTGFKTMYLMGGKIHTIRKGDYWRKVVEEVNAGRAILSIREWSGKPYRSKQIEISTHYKLGWQNITCIDGLWSVDGITVYHSKIATNDGLSFLDFNSWFPKNFNGGIIHFTDFRY
jgi:hypothetical protein